MTCHKCGLQTLPEQRFCRSCGTSLQITTQPLARPVAESDPEIKSAQTWRERANKYVLSGFIVMLLGVAIGVIGKKLMHQDLVTVIGVLISLVGMFLTVYPYLAPSRRTKHDPTQSQLDEITHSRPSNTLPRERSPEYVASITERTTDLLEDVPVARRTAEDGKSSA